jgi:hypothetical protein
MFHKNDYNGIELRIIIWFIDQQLFIFKFFMLQGYFLTLYVIIKKLWNN